MYKTRPVHSSMYTEYTSVKKITFLKTARIKLVVFTSSDEKFRREKKIDTVRERESCKNLIVEIIEEKRQGMSYTYSR